MDRENDAINYMLIRYTGEPETSARHSISQSFDSDPKKKVFIGSGKH